MRTHAAATSDRGWHAQGALQAIAAAGLFCGTQTAQAHGALAVQQQGLDFGLGRWATPIPSNRPASITRTRAPWRPTLWMRGDAVHNGEWQLQWHPPQTRCGLCSSVQIRACHRELPDHHRANHQSRRRGYSPTGKRFIALIPQMAGIGCEYLGKQMADLCEHLDAIVAQKRRPTDANRRQSPLLA